MWVIGDIYDILSCLSAHARCGTTIYYFLLMGTGISLITHNLGRCHIPCCIRMSLVLVKRQEYPHQAFSHYDNNETCIHDDHEVFYHLPLGIVGQASMHRVLPYRKPGLLTLNHWCANADELPCSCEISSRFCTMIPNAFYLVQHISAA